MFSIIGGAAFLLSSSSKEDQATLREAFEVARETEGATAPIWVLLEAPAAEFIGSVAPVLVREDEGNAQMSGNGASGAQMSGNGAGGAQMSGNGADGAPKIRRRDAGLRIYSLPKPWIDECSAWLKQWTEGWSFLEQNIPTVPGIELPDQSCAFALDQRLRKLARMRQGWGELTGRLALLIKFHRLLGIRNGIPLEAFVRSK